MGGGIGYLGYMDKTVTIFATDVFADAYEAAQDALEQVRCRCLLVEDPESVMAALSAFIRFMQVGTSEYRDRVLASRR